jgi:hypothetical protein
MRRKILIPHSDDDEYDPSQDSSRKGEALKVLTPEERMLWAGGIPQEPEPTDYDSYNDMRSFWHDLGESSGYDVGFGDDSNFYVQELLTPEKWDDISLFLDDYEAAFQTWKTKDYPHYIKKLQAFQKYQNALYGYDVGSFGEFFSRRDFGEEDFDSEGFKYQNNKSSFMQALGLVGTLVGFGGFGYSVVKLWNRDWKAAALGVGVGAVALSLVGWNMRKLSDAVPFMADGDAMDPKEVEKILEASKGKIVSVTFIKRTTGELRTLVGRIGKKYTPPGGKDPLGGKAGRRGRNLFTIYDMQKQAFRMVSMDSVIQIKAGGKRYHG